ncbi:DNA primase large subunit PriL [Halorubellus sp. JP-L1]|uniref:DNA primase large subunit PriL n=1 Tax=Halorubellus sp. JP-L1 TaxID=2715753 RepID=UPI00140A6D5A|nr:DNA primase large subunit PriL [Halorubellus sp. JP-L1]NHN43565.1 DNA primase large subunit PriL [Halorubellus sp. JP-L1]
MEALHARYPFFESAREAVDAAAVDLGELVVREDAPAVERAVERVTTALTDGDVGAPRRRTRTELLSYPVARVLVSLVDEPVVTRTYAQAEAATAIERVRADVTEDADLSYGSAGEVTLPGLLDEFDLTDAVRAVEEDATTFRVDVTAYLRLSSGLDGDAWRLNRRALADGDVPVDRDELLVLLRQAVEDRVAEGLPLGVPDAIADALAPAIAQVEEVLADIDVAVDIDRVLPELFPPCVQALLERARDGEELPAHSWFSLCSFCATIGMDAPAVLELLDVTAETDPVLAQRVRYGMERVAGERGVEYPLPSCETMDAYGDCVNKDDLCAEVAHPTGYYEARVDASGD